MSFLKILLLVFIQLALSPISTLRADDSPEDWVFGYSEVLDNRDSRYSVETITDALYRGKISEKVAEKLVQLVGERKIKLNFVDSAINDLATGARTEKAFLEKLNSMEENYSFWTFPVGSPTKDQREMLRKMHEAIINHDDPNSLREAIYAIQISNPKDTYEEQTSDIIGVLRSNIWNASEGNSPNYQAQARVKSFLIEALLSKGYYMPGLHSPNDAEKKLAKFAHPFSRRGAEWYDFYQDERGLKLFKSLRKSYSYALSTYLEERKKSESTEEVASSVDENVCLDPDVGEKAQREKRYRWGLKFPGFTKLLRNVEDHFLVAVPGESVGLLGTAQGVRVCNGKELRQHVVALINKNPKIFDRPNLPVSEDGEWVGLTQFDYKEKDGALEIEGVSISVKKKALTLIAK